MIKLLIGGAIGALIVFWGQWAYFKIKKAIFYNDLNVPKIKRSK